jgi:iron(III) transport system permease protein
MGDAQKHLTILKKGSNKLPYNPCMTPQRPSFLLSGLSLLAMGLALPMVALLGSWFAIDAQGGQILSEMAATVLPEYAMTSVWLCLGVGMGVMLVGAACALAVTLFDFHGRRLIEWALLLPMAMPAYVLAYAYTDFLQYSGPMQSILRQMLGWQGRVLPEVRSLGGAIIVFTLALYPYVYVLARAALAERAPPLFEAARLLGANLGRRVWRVALPLARPAVAAGVALALMEVLADFGVSSYFGIQTFTAGIYKAWLVMDNRMAAAELSTALLGLVALLLAWEKQSRSRQRFATSRPDRMGPESKPVHLRGLWAWLALFACLLPILLGFVGPVLILLFTLITSDVVLGAYIGRFGAWAANSLMLATMTAGLATLIALGLNAQVRLWPGRWGLALYSLVGLGYAMPGAVVVVGLLLPLGAAQALWPDLGLGYLFSASVLGLVWAYLVRFVAVAQQSIHSGYTRIPVTLDDGARTLGVSGWRLVGRVHAPLLRRPLAAAALLVFVDVMKELPVTLVLRPFNTDTLAVMAHQLARDERLGEAALPALALVAVGLLPVILLSRTLRQR